MTIVVPELKMVKTSGTGDIDLIGSFQTGDFNAKTSGTGDIEAKQLRAASVNLESSGTGDISITSTSHLNLVYAETTGTGDITIVGSAAGAVYRASAQAMWKPPNEGSECRGCRFRNRRHRMLCVRGILRLGFGCRRHRGERKSGHENG